MSKKTAVIGASPNDARYSFRATKMLSDYNHEVVPLGIRKGVIGEHEIIVDWPKEIDDLNTVTLYIGPQRQPEYYDYIINLKPNRVIFNPGTENPEFESKLHDAEIETENACTLVMLSTSQY